MEEAEHDSPEVVTVPPQPGLWLFLSVPMVGIIFCGTKEPWALGSLAVLVGLTAIFATPRYRVPPWLVWPVILGLSFCLLAFLPAGWFTLPEWRQTLQRDFGIIMPSTLSPQPGVTFESWLALAMGAVWLICCAARGFATSERRLAIRVLAVFCGLVACAAIAVRHWEMIIPFWRGPWNMEYFGPFPNRNLLSELLAVGAVLVFASTYDAFRRKQGLWLPLALIMVPIFSAVLLNTSRTGVIILFLGIGAWMFTATFQRRSAHRVSIAAAVLLVMATVFLLYGERISERFFRQDGSLIATLSSDSRVYIFADAFRMMASAPLIGVGLGNFEPVFAILRTQSDSYSRSLHPENDWLMLGAEAGIPCLLLAVVIALSLISRFGPWRIHDTSGRRDRRLRNAAGIGVMLICLAGTVDVPMHAPGLFGLGALLAGLALRPSAQPVAAASSRLSLRLAGGCCVLAGFAWLAIAFGHPVIRGNSVYRQLAAQAASLSASGDAAGALERWDEAASIKPLQWNIYFERAWLKLRLGRNSREALEDFGRTRYLEPHNGIICTQEFDIWQDFDPVSGIPALHEAVRRLPTRAVEFYEGRISNVHRYPKLRPHMRAIAEGNPHLLLAYLLHATKDEFASCIDSILALDPSLGSFPSAKKLSFFRVWYERGDAERLIQLLIQNDDWLKDGWPVLAAHKAKQGDFRAAYEVALGQVPEPPRYGPLVTQADLGQLRRAFEMNRTDLPSGFRLYEAQRSQGRYDEALETLGRLSAIPRFPSRVLYERGVTLAAKGDHAKAWESLREYHERLERETAEAKRNNYK